MVQAYATAPGSIANIRLRIFPESTSSLCPFEVELSVCAVGLNFRDVLNVLGLDPTGTLRPLGLECAGIVHAIGSDVKTLPISKPVYGLTLGCLQTRVRTDARVQVPIPNHISFEEASTLPILWPTVNLAFCESAAMNKATHMLNHTAAGVVGLVAVEYSRRVDVLLLATAGSRSKHTYLRSTQHIRLMASSRDECAFAAGAGALLRGERYHAICTALSKQFIANSVALLQAQGDYLEIGKNGIWSPQRLSAAYPSARFKLIATDYQHVRRNTIEKSPFHHLTLL